MTSLGVMLLVASATTGFDVGDARAGGLHFFKHSAVVSGPADPADPVARRPADASPTSRARSSSSVPAAPAVRVT
jgi:hypothetical protein